MTLGYRESTDSWAAVLRDLRERGLDAPLLAVGDGGLGLWAALREVYPATRHQRCWNHRARNVLDRLPKRLWPDARGRLRQVREAPTRAACEARRDELAVWLHEPGQDPAAETLYRDWDDFVAFYDFPAEHWLHLRTSNPIESVFAGVRLRTNVAKRARVRENALYLVFKIVKLLGHPLAGPQRRGDGHGSRPRRRTVRRPGPRQAATTRGGGSGLIRSTVEGSFHAT